MKKTYISPLAQTVDTLQEDLLVVSYNVDNTDEYDSEHGQYKDEDGEIEIMSDTREGSTQEETWGDLW